MGHREVKNLPEAPSGRVSTPPARPRHRGALSTQEVPDRQGAGSLRTVRPAQWGPHPCVSLSAQAIVTKWHRQAAPTADISPSHAAGRRAGRLGARAWGPPFSLSPDVAEREQVTSLLRPRVPRALITSRDPSSRVHPLGGQGPELSIRPITLSGRPVRRSGQQLQASGGCVTGAPGAKGKRDPAGRAEGIQAEEPAALGPPKCKKGEHGRGLGVPTVMGCPGCGPSGPRVQVAGEEGSRELTKGDVAGCFRGSSLHVWTQAQDSWWVGRGAGAFCRREAWGGGGWAWGEGMLPCALAPADAPDRSLKGLRWPLGCGCGVGMQMA